MSQWYQCADVLSAVDSYDVLGVPPGPDDPKFTPLQRSMELMVLPMATITSCFDRTLQCVGENTVQAQAVINAYQSLQNNKRDSYDLRCLSYAAEAAST